MADRSIHNTKNNLVFLAWIITVAGHFNELFTKHQKLTSKSRTNRYVFYYHYYYFIYFVIGTYVIVHTHTQIAIFKEFLLNQPGDELANIFMGVDATYQTRGYTAVHGGTVFRSIKFWAALIAAHAISHNDLDNPCVTTTCTIERVRLVL